MAWSQRLMVFGALVAGSFGWSACSQRGEANGRPDAGAPVEVAPVQPVDAPPDEADPVVSAEPSAREQLDAVRAGLASDDERAVFAAVAASGGLPVPELAHAASVVAPRLGEDDCPLRWEDTLEMWGSGDFAALAAAIARLPEKEAVEFLGNLHRMTRPESIAPLCAIAVHSQGEVRRAAFADARMTVDYSEQQVSLLAEAALACVGRQPDPEPDGRGLPGTLRAVLRTWLEIEGLPKDDELAQQWPGSAVTAFARWLAAARPGPQDLPLLQTLMAAPWPMNQAAFWAIGALDDDESLQWLREGQDLSVDDVVVVAARARRGDAAALAQLLAGDEKALRFGLALATTDQRRVVFERLWRMPVENALDMVQNWQWWFTGAEVAQWVEPAFDDALFTGLGAMLADDKNLDVRVLRALAGSLPSCTTGPIADALLARPLDQLFAVVSDGDEFDPLDRSGMRSPGFLGVWPFLEVTRPDAFRARLREGFAGDDEAVRAVCARLLMGIGDDELAEPLAAWIVDGERDDSWWELLAKGGGAKTRALLQRRLAATEDEDERDLMAAALALSWGLEREQFDVADDRVRAALVAGDVDGAVRAMLDTPGEFRGDPADYAGIVGPEVRAMLRQRLEAEVEDANYLFARDCVFAVTRPADVSLDGLFTALRDGRYATHGTNMVTLAAAVGGPQLLPFWIDQLDSNCCKVAVIEEAFTQLFAAEAHAVDRAKWREPASVALRRTLLPAADRLRWSRIAGAYVVAGG